MAIIHRAELSPSKPEILQELLSSRSWGESGELEVIGAYRFDDPEGEVGIECHVVRVGETIYHLPLTYRGTPLEGAEESLVGTMQHSVLGERHIYDGLGDELALDCFRRALEGEQEQAELQIVDAEGAVVEIRPQSVILRREVDVEASEVEDALDSADEDVTFIVARTLGDLDGAVRLVASWDGGEGVVAAF